MAAPFEPSPFTFGLFYDEKKDDVNTKRELSYAGERAILMFGVNGVGKSTRELLRKIAASCNWTSRAS
jgi:signal recognition particle GTPase